MLKMMAALTAGLVTVGGWAVVTVKDLPEYFVAGQQYTIEFQVRQHGRNLLGDLEPELIVSTSAPRLGGLFGAANEQRIRAASRGVQGTYAATFTAPTTGQVFLRIKSGFGASDLRLYPAPVVATGAAPPAMAQADRGRVLFVAKGCNACHSNSDLIDRPDNQQVKVGPELGGRRLDRELVIQKVKNPASETMPNLGLSDAEAAAIAAFLGGERTASSGGSR
jgi:hypothetical protein